MGSIKIIDLSSNNGSVDFAKIKAAGVEHVYIRTSMGVGCEDKMCKTFADGATAAGLKVSYYHFAYPSTPKNGRNIIQDANEESDYFCDCVQALPPFEFLTIDLEPFGNGKDTLLSKDDYSLWIQTFLDHVYARTGAECIIYTYADYLNQHLPANHSFGNKRLWIANYGNITNPPLPHGWSSYFMGQYSESGSVDGVQAHVDCSKFNPATI